MKFVALLSSGIDSPVAIYLLSKKADEVILLHADNHPFIDTLEIGKFVRLARYLKTVVSSKVTAMLIPNGQSLQIYKTCCNNKFICIFCKRMMLRYAEIIAKQENADAIIMGDSLGQVASQTLKNLRVIEQAVSIPILRPLIGFDKDDTIQLAKKIGTFPISVAQTDECGAVPMKPSTQARFEQILAEELKINIYDLIQYAIKHVKIVPF